MSTGEAPKLHRTRWTAAEDEFLQESWDGTRETAAVIGELLERTVDAVAQRHYMLTWGTAAEPVEVKPEPGESRPTRTTYVRVTVTEYELRVTDQVCPSCWLVLPASGVCGNC